MSTILVTGASGYIGRRFVSRAREAGHSVIFLGSSILASKPGIPWRLGEAPDSKVFTNVNAVIHLAHSWHNEATGVSAATNINMRGSEALARAALDGKVGRFVFVSSVSARPQALNIYGRVKYETERLLLALGGSGHSIVCARVGLVYGGARAGQYGTMSKLTSMTPVLPMVGLDRPVQPIHVDEVCDGLLALAIAPLLSQQTYVLAAPKPMQFGEWLRLLRRVQTGKNLLLISLPLSLVLGACRLLGVLPWIPRVDRERILGLAGTQFIESAQDLEMLDITVGNPETALESADLEMRALVREAAILLRYIMDCKPPLKAVARLALAIQRQGDGALYLPGVIAWQPALLRFIDPLTKRYSKLERHLLFAVMVAEALPGRRPTGWAGALIQLFLEIFALPFRVTLGFLRE